MQSNVSKTTYLALALGVFCIGTSAIFVRLANVSGTVSAFYRVLFAGKARARTAIHRLAGDQLRHGAFACCACFCDAIGAVA